MLLREAAAGSFRAKIHRCQSVCRYIVAGLSANITLHSMLADPLLREAFLIRDGGGWRPPRVNETCCRRPKLAELLRAGERIWVKRRPADTGRTCGPLRIQRRLPSLPQVGRRCCSQAGARRCPDVGHSCSPTATSGYCLICNHAFLMPNMRPQLSCLTLRLFCRQRPSTAQTSCTPATWDESWPRTFRRRVAW